MEKSNPSEQIQRIVTLSNQVAEYPPLDLTKLQYQALLILVSCIDSTEKPIYSIDDIVEDIKAKGITDTHEQMLYLEELILRQNTYRIPYKDYLRYFTGGETPQGSVVQRALEAVLSLNNKAFKFNNPDYEGSFVWFQAVAVDKKSNDLVFVITSFAKPLLMGLRRDFLQMLAESTIDFDGKYSVPIFLYMKSKLFDGRNEFHGSESLDTFKRRFGLDGIKTYDRFFDFQRRILEVAEKDSARSGDVKFVFTGVPEPGSKKVVELQYSIYRIGNIKKRLPQGTAAKLQDSENEAQNHKIIGNEITKERNNDIIDDSHRSKVAALTASQRRAYQFLAEQGVNKAFVIDKILVHPNFKHEILLDREDEYLEIIWHWFVKRTKSDEKAGAFVSWWKNGRLTRTEVHWQAVESLNRRVKISEKKQTVAPQVQSLFSEKELNDEKTKSLINEIRNPKINRRLGQNINFNIETFKTEHAAAYQRIAREREIAFSEFKDAPNFQQLVERSIISHCESWFINNVS